MKTQVMEQQRLTELIADSNGKYYCIFSAQELKRETNNYDQKNVLAEDTSYNLYTMYKGCLMSFMQFHGHEYRPCAYKICINNITYAAQMCYNHILQLIVLTALCLDDKLVIKIF